MDLDKLTREFGTIVGYRLLDNGKLRRRNITHRVADLEGYYKRAWGLLNLLERTNVDAYNKLLKTELDEAGGLLAS